MTTEGEKRDNTGAFAALRDATGAAIIAALLAFPIVALRTEQNERNDLVLEERWLWMAGAAGVIFLLRLGALQPSTFGLLLGLVFFSAVV